MNKNIVYISTGVIFIILIGIFVSFINIFDFSNNHQVQASGYSYSSVSEQVEFSENSKFTKNESNGNKLYDNNKVVDIDPAGLLFYEDNNIQTINNSVAIINANNVIENAEGTVFKKEGNTYKLLDKDGEDSNQSIPVGTIVKLSQHKYLILDEVTLQENGKEEKKIGSNVFLTINDGNSARLMANGEYIETANPKHSLKLASKNGCEFSILNENIACNNNNEIIDLALISVDFNDEVESTSELVAKTNEKQKKDEEAKQIEEKTAESTKQAIENSSSSQNATQAPVTQAQPASQISKSTPGGNSNNNGGSNGSNNGSGNTSGENNLTPENAPLEGPTQKELEEMISKLKLFKIPTIDVDYTIANNNISVSGNIFDEQGRIEKLDIHVVDINGNIIFESPIDFKNKDFKYEIPNLKYGDKYYLNVVGQYKLLNDESSNEIVFYADTFQIENMNYSSEVTNIEDNKVEMILKSNDVKPNLTKLVLEMKQNNSASKGQSIFYNVDIEEFIRNGQINTMFEGLESNSEYVITIHESEFDNEINDNPINWYQNVKTAKAIPKINALNFEYIKKTDKLNMNVQNIEDPDVAIDTLEYKIYELNDYQLNGTFATSLANKKVYDTEIYQGIELPKPNTITSGEFIFVIDVTIDDGYKKYSFVTEQSNVIEIGTKIKPSATFNINDAKANELTIQYEIIDPDSLILKNNIYPTKFLLFNVDQNGEITGEPIYSETISKSVLDMDLKTSSVRVDKLSKLTSYKAIITSSYQIDFNEDAILDEIIGDSEIFSTTDVSEIIPEYKIVTPESNNATINIRLKSDANSLTNAKVQIFDAVTLETVGDAIDVAQYLEEMRSIAGTNINFTNLQPNTKYFVSLIEGFDNGENSIPFTGNLEFLTLKNAPIVDKVNINYTNSIGTGEFTYSQGANNEGVIDEYNSITGISYYFYDVKNLNIPLNNNIITDLNNIYELNKFSVLDPSMGRGKTYVLKSEIIWNDNYENHKIELTSDSFVTEKESITSDFRLISRDKDTTKMQVTIIDPENTSIPGSIKLRVNAQEFPLEIGLNEIEFPSEAVFQTVTAEALFKINEADNPNIKELNQILLPPVIKSDIINNIIASYQKENRKLNIIQDYNQILADNVVKSVTSFVFSGDKVFDSILMGVDALDQALISLPQSPIWLGGTYEFNINNKVFYTSGEMNFTDVPNFIYITDDLYQNYVTSLKGSVVMESANENASLLNLVGGFIDSDGNIRNVKIKNTNNNLFFNSQISLVDNSPTPSEFDFMKQPNGSYVAKSNGKYINFKTGLYVEDVALAPQLMFYTVGQKETISTQEIYVDGLNAPVIKAENLQVFDKYVNFNLSTNDIDNTIITESGKSYFRGYVKNKLTNQIVKEEFYFTNIADQNLTLDELQPDTNYTLVINAKYDVLDGKGIIDNNFEEIDFKTNKELPSVQNVQYSWDSTCNGRTTRAVTRFSDPNKAIQNVRYVWYEKTNDLQYDPTNLKLMQEVLMTKTPVSSFTSTATSFDMPQNVPENYLSNKNYVIAVYIDTAIKGSESYLANVSTLLITPPPTAVTNLVVDQITEKSVRINFNYTDQYNYFGCDTNKNFTYKLKEVETGLIVDQGTFKGTNTVNVLKQFTGLRFKTKYDIIITTKFNQLDGLGERDWTKTARFTTLDDYASSNSVKLSYNPTTKIATSSVSNIVPGSSTIHAMNMKLYRINNFGEDNEFEELVDMKQISLPDSYPFTTQSTFDLSRSPDGVYFTQLFIQYYVSTPNDLLEYTSNSFAFNHTGVARAMTMRMLTNDVGVIEMDTVDQTTSKDNKILITDNTGQIIDEDTVSNRQLANGYRIENIDQYEQVNVVVSDINTSEITSSLSVPIELKHITASVIDNKFNLASNDFNNESGNLVVKVVYSGTNLFDTLFNDNEVEFIVKKEELKNLYENEVLGNIKNIEIIDEETNANINVQMLLKGDQ